jgi:ABC-type transporter Mla maintaining outer membrane lipid asymmetry ATPase subunit MlaF
MRHEGFSSIARAVGVVPIHQEVIVFDEPTRGIDLAVGPVAALVAALARKRRQRAP